MMKHCFALICTCLPLVGKAQIKPKVFKTAIRGPIEILDPGLYTSYGEQILLHNLTETLVRLNPETGNIEPAAAESYSVSSDGKTLNFKLRKDLKWSNGKPITAFDFAYGIRRVLLSATHSKHQAKLASILGALEQIEGALLGPQDLGIQATSPTDLTIKMKVPDTFILWSLSQPYAAPIQKEGLARNGYTSLSATTFLSSGPFVVSAFDAKHILLSPNPHHRFAKKIAIDGVDAKLLTDSYIGVQLFEMGELDQFGHADFGIPESEVQRFASNLALVRQLDTKLLYLKLNPNTVPFSSPQLRQALAMSIERPLLVESLLLPKEVAAFSILPPLGTFYGSPTTFFFNPTKANQLLGQSGYCSRKAPAVKCKEPMRLEIAYSVNPTIKKVGSFLSQLVFSNLQIGDVTLLPMSQEELDSHIKSGVYMAYLDEISSTPEYPFALIEALANNDSLAEKAFTSTLTEALDLFRQIEVRLMTEQGIVPLIYGSTPIFINPNVSGYTPNVFDLHPWSDVVLK